MKSGLQLVTNERHEQIEKHGRTVERDIRENPDGQLAKGALALIHEHYGDFPEEWDGAVCAHMYDKPYKERIITAAALLVAELDRLNYLENNKSL